MYVYPSIFVFLFTGGMITVNILNRGGKNGIDSDTSQEINFEEEIDGRKMARGPEITFYPGQSHQSNSQYEETKTTTTTRPWPREYEEKYDEEFYPSPTHQSNIQYEETKTTTTARPWQREYEEEGEESDDSGSCVLTNTPPEPSSKCCGIDASTNNRIVGGNRTSIEQYPWLVRIEYYISSTGTYDSVCNGFLISGRYSLSAAHCFVGPVLDRRQPANIIVGDYNISNAGADCISTPKGERFCTEGEDTVPIEDYMIHPEYSYEPRRISNDIALVRTQRIVKYSVFIRPLCLPTRDITESTSNLIFYVAGWGAVEDRIENLKHFYKYDDVKRDVAVPFVDRETCNPKYGFLDEGHICAGGESGKDSCKSDSGGPLMYQDDSVYEVVGIVSTSWGQQVCGTQGLPAVYTKIYPYLSWIRNNIKP